MVFVIGAHIDQLQDSLGGSEYLKLAHGLIGGPLRIDLQLEARVHRAVLAMIKEGVAVAAHDCSDGGLAVAVAEMCLAGNLGIDGSAAPLGPRIAAGLFGETQSRILLAVPEDKRTRLIEIATFGHVPFQFVGTVTHDLRVRLGPIDLPLEDIRAAYEGGLANALVG
jgi:phosphoribosylformylglycinamidine synthase